MGHVPGVGVVIMAATASSLAPAHCGKVVPLLLVVAVMMVLMLVL